MSLNTSELSSTSGGAKATNSLISTFRSLNAEPEAPTIADVTLSDLSTPFVRTPEEEALLISQLKSLATEESEPQVANADEFWLLACIRARKGDVTRALALAKNCLKWRESVNADGIKLNNCEQMKKQLETGMVFVSGNKNRLGQVILDIRLGKQDPARFSALDTTRMISFVLEWVLRTYPEAQTHGIVVVNNMKGVSLGNLDLRMPGVLQKAFSRNMPVRVSSVNICNPPWFIRMVLSLAAKVFSKKLKARVRVYGKGDAVKMEEMFEKDSIMIDLDMGGTAVWTDDMREKWINKMMTDCQQWPPSTTHVTEQETEH